MIYVEGCMKLYEATNGFIGNSHVSCLVIAESEDEALEMARQKYKEESDSEGYGEKYYQNIKIRLLCDYASKCFVSDINN